MLHALTARGETSTTLLCRCPGDIPLCRCTLCSIAFPKNLRAGLQTSCHARGFLALGCEQNTRSLWGSTRSQCSIVPCPTAKGCRRSTAAGQRHNQLPVGDRPGRAGASPVPPGSPHPSSAHALLCATQPSWVTALLCRASVASAGISLGMTNEHNTSR